MYYLMTYFYAGFELYYFMDAFRSLTRQHRQKLIIGSTWYHGTMNQILQNKLSWMV